MKSMAMVVPGLLFATFALAQYTPRPIPQPIPRPIPAPNPGPLPTPVLYPVTCSPTNPLPIARVAKEPGKPVFIYPDDSRLTLGEFLKTLVDGSTVYLREGHFDLTVAVPPTSREFKRLHLVGRGILLTALMGALTVREGSSFEYLDFENLGTSRGRSTLNVYGSYVTATNIVIHGGSMGIAVGVEDWAGDTHLPSPGPLSAMSLIACVRVTWTTVAGVSHCGTGDWGGTGNGSILRDIDAHPTSGEGICFNGDRIEYTRLHSSGGARGIVTWGNGAGISQARVESVTGTCITVANGYSSTVDHATVSECGDMGILVYSDHSRVLGSSVTNVGTTGIVLEGNYQTVDHSQVTGVRDTAHGVGITIARLRGGNTVNACAIDHARIGILDETTHGSTLTGNTFSNISWREISTVP